MNSTILAIAVIVSVILAAVIAVQRVKYKNLVQQTQQSMQDLKEKEAILEKEAMIKAKEALHNEREQLNEDERERRREFAAIESKLSKREDIIENTPSAPRVPQGFHQADAHTSTSHNQVPARSYPYSKADGLPRPSDAAHGQPE